ncbi:MAG: SusC/RagA family TonB-linked outer membrane protein, partial [Bacteroidetes bacterium]
MKKICLIFAILVFMGNVLVAQERRITGTVTDAADGSTMPGVTIAVKGTTQGTATDANGRYEITVAEGATLVYSFIGMVSEERVVGTANTINVALSADIATLQEIVVVGYGTRLKYELTGSISSVRAEDIAGHTMPSFETALHGRAAGVHISAGTGKLGQQVRTRIRGASSISASNQPLYVIDGIPVQSANLGTAGNEPTNPLADLNPADIQSIDILKDASAAAIYGSRAANGVILITTKRGREGRTRFNISTQYGFSEAANKMGFLNREQYIDLWRTAAINRYGPDDNWQARLDNQFPFWRDPNNPDDLTKGPDTNWEDQALRRGASQQFDISASGGTAETQYFVSLSFTDQEAIIVKNQFDRIGGRLNLDHKASDIVSFGMNMSLNRSRNFRVSHDRAFSTPIQMTALPPLDPTHDPVTGEINTRTTYENGLMPLKYSDFSTEVFRNFGNVFVNIDILPGLTFRSEAGLDILHQQEIEYQGRLTNDGGPDGSGFERHVKSMLYNFENYFVFNRVFAEEYDLNLVVG